MLKNVDITTPALEFNCSSVPALSPTVSSRLIPSDVWSEKMRSLEVKICAPIVQLEAELTSIKSSSDQGRENSPALRFKPLSF